MGQAPQRKVPAAKAMIVAPQPEAVAAGAEILRAGGSALDAVIACAMVQGVVDPLMCGIGGFGMLHIYDPATGTRKVYEGFGGCPIESRPDMWKDIVLGETTDGFGFIVKDFINEAGVQSVTAPGLLKENSRNKDAAWKYLNALLNPEGQVHFAKAMGYAPTVRNAVLPPELMATVGFTPEELARIHPYDLKALASQRAASLDFWNKEFKAGL